jgi:hypothetical protein
MKRGEEGGENQNKGRELLYKPTESNKMERNEKKGDEKRIMKRVGETCPMGNIL